MIRPVCLLFSLLLIVGGAWAQTSCLECHQGNESVREEGLPPAVDGSSYRASVHGAFECRDCHSDAVGDPHPEKLSAADCAACHRGQAEECAGGVHAGLSCGVCHTLHAVRSATDSASSVHAARQPATCGACHRRGEGDKARPYAIGVHGSDEGGGGLGCSDCHGNHRVLPRSDPASAVYSAGVSAVCSDCHEHEAEEYLSGVHGTTRQSGQTLSPNCVTCHTAHDVRFADDPASPTHPLNIADQICGACHGSERFNARLGLPPEVFRAYKDSYHGLAAGRGSALAAGCGSCHGVHAVRSKSDPKSSIHPANVQRTCARCHPYAGADFAQSYSHADFNALGIRAAAVVRQVYLVLIAVIIGGMVLHNLILWSAHLRAKLRALKGRPVIRRFDSAWIVQHFIVMISFTVLAVTGFALKYPQAGWVRLLMRSGMTEAVRGGLHRAAAVALILTGIFHLGCLFFRRSWKGEFAALKPTAEDFRHLLMNLKHHLVGGRAPSFGRYSYIEKAEYWSLLWGTVIMAVTGAVLWVPALSTRVLPAWSVQAAEAIHFYEAVLAVLAIVLYHLYFAVFHPTEYPLNLTAFTGTIAEDEAREKYPRWVESLEEGTNDKISSKEPSLQPKGENDATA